MTDKKSLIASSLLVACLVSPAVAEPPAESDRFTPISALAGRCFEGQMGDGKVDTHCWDWAINDRFLRDTHRVTGGEEVYSGETLYGWDESAGVLRFWYFNSLGGVSEGTVEQVEGRWTFKESYRGPGSEIEFRSVFDQAGDGYAVISERKSGERWELFFEVRYEPLEGAPDWVNASR